MEREIKVTFGELKGYEHNDRINIEFSPNELTNLRYMLRAQATEAGDYTDQELKHQLYDVFSTAREMWEKARREKDK